MNLTAMMTLLHLRSSLSTAELLIDIFEKQNQCDCRESAYISTFWLGMFLRFLPTDCLFAKNHYSRYCNWEASLRKKKALDIINLDPLIADVAASTNCTT